MYVINLISLGKLNRNIWYDYDFYENFINLQVEILILDLVRAKARIKGTILTMKSTLKLKL